ncbi:MAG: glycosyltransferase, partial [Desulfatirhabdiaceae bacterium]
MQSPLISVIIPAYNHESYIVDAIQSVLKQSFSDCEVIVIDDGSTDNTLYEIKKITDPRIRLFHQKNIGAAATINRGIDLSQGQYITILNSDDVYHSDRLAIFKEYMDDHPDVMVLSSLIQPVDVLGNELTPDSGNTVHQYWLKWYERAVQNIQQDNHYFYSLLQSNFVVSTSNIFVNARLFENEKKFDPFLYYCHDYEFLLRALQVHRFGLIHQKLLKYRLHDLNTIRHNDFFKRFEVQYAVYHALKFHDLLSHPPDVQQRLSSILFRGLERNPDINHDIIASEKNRLLEQSDLWLKEAQMNARHFEDRLMQVEKQNECLQARIVESQKQNECLQARIVENQKQNECLQARIVESQKQNECLQARILEMNARIQEKELHLSNLIEEIRQKDVYLDEAGNHAKNLKEIAERKQENILELNRRIENLENSVALHRQAEIDFKTRIHQQSIQLHAADARMIMAENNAAEKERFLQEIFHSKGWRWLTRYRDAKLKFMSRHPVIDKSQPVTDDKTYHAVIHHAMKANRPKVIHAIANFLTGGSSRLVVDLVEHLGHIYDQEVMSFFIPSPLA